MKIMTIVGTRPEIIKLSRVISELHKHGNHVLVHTGQNYDFELNEVFFKEMDLPSPNYVLKTAAKNPAKNVAQVIAKSYEIMTKEQPDAILIYGDTNSCLSAYSAKRLKIPIFHMEAGNRCFDQRVPEEINRKIIDHLSDVNMTISEHARNYLIREGIRPETVFKIGSTMNEVLNHYKQNIQNSSILEKLKIMCNEYFLISLHREENVDTEKNFNDFMQALKQISKEFRKKIIISTHPRTRKKLEVANEVNANSDIILSKPFGFFDYVKLQKDAYCVISDSGTITEESSILGFPSITVRQTHERPEGMDEGTLIMSGLLPENVLQTIKIVTRQKQEGFTPKIVSDYSSTIVSPKVIRIIYSYIEYTNINTWKKTNL